MSVRTDRRCANCERCTWHPGPDCGIPEHPHCERCGHCNGRHAPTGRGRPRIGTRIDLVIPDADLEDLDIVAAEDGVSRAELIRRILDSWLSDHGAGA